MLSIFALKPTKSRANRARNLAALQPSSRKRPNASAAPTPFTNKGHRLHGPENGLPERFLSQKSTQPTTLQPGRGTAAAAAGRVETLPGVRGRSAPAWEPPAGGGAERVSDTKCRHWGSCSPPGGRGDAVVTIGRACFGGETRTRSAGWVSAQREGVSPSAAVARSALLSGMPGGSAKRGRRPQAGGAGGGSEADPKRR